MRFGGFDRVVGATDVARKAHYLVSTSLTGGVLAAMLAVSPAAAQCVTAGNQTTCNPLNANTTVTAVGPNLSTTITVLNANPGFMLTANGAATPSSGSVAVTVASGVNMVSGAGQHGILGNGNGDTLVVNLIGTVAGTGGSGLMLNSGPGVNGVAAIVNNNVTGGAGDGITINNVGTGAVSIVGVGNITGTGANFGINVANNNAAAVNVDIRQTGVITGGTAGGIQVNNVGAGNIIIGTADAAIRGVNATGGTGISAVTTGPGIVSIVTAGTVGGGIVDGIVARSDSGAIAITAGGSITAAGGAGIDAGTDGRIDIINRGVASGAQGVVSSSATGSTVVINEGGIAGTAGAGVNLGSSTGSLTLINNASREVAGTTTGARLAATGAGNVLVDNEGTIRGTAGFGVSASSAGGALSVVNVGTIQGNSTGVFASNSGAGAINVLNEGAIIGNTGVGVQAQNLAGNGSIYVGNDAGAVIQSNNGGVFAIGNTGNVRFDNAGTVNGGASFGVRLSSSGGSVAIENRSSITGGAASQGVDLQSAGAGVINYNGVAGSSVVGGVGIQAIQAPLGTGDVFVTNAGTVQGTVAQGIVTQSTVGAHLITNTGAVTGATVGIQTTTTTGNQRVDNFAAVTGGTIGFQTQTTTGTATVNNMAGAVINAPVIYNNNGGIGVFNNLSTVTGGFTSAAAATSTTINNAGTWNGTAALATMAGAGDVVNNWGIVNGPINMAGLETFNNNSGGVLNVNQNVTLTGTALNNNGGGRINVAGTLTAGSVTNGAIINLNGGTITAPITNNGVINVPNSSTITGNVINNAGGVIDLSTSNPTTGQVLTVNGALTGAGRSLLDVNLGAARTSDRLVVQGGSAVNVGIVTTADAAIAGSAITLVQGGAGTTYQINGTAIGAGGLQVLNTGLLQQFAVQVGNDLQIVTGVNTQTIGGVTAGVSAVLSSLNSFSEPASAFVTGPSNPDPNTFKPGAWARVRAGQFDIKSGSVVNSGILGVRTINNKMTTEFGGFQAGLDAGIYNINNTGWNVVLGAHGGQVTGSAGDGDTTIKLDQPFYGAYLVVKNDNFTFDAMIRRDEVDMKVSSGSGAFLNRKQNAKGWSGLVSAQYRFDVTESLRVTPSVAFLFSSIDVDPLSVNGITTRWSTLNSQIGRVGVDVSYIYALSPQVFLLPFVNASLWHEFASNVRAATVAGTTNISTSTNRVGTYGQVGLGTAIAAPGSGFTGFVRGDLRFGEKISGYAINGGLRWQF